MRFLSEEDARILRELVADYRRRFPKSGKRTGKSAPQSLSTDCYIIKPQSAIDAVTSGTPDVAGVGDCDIYDIIDNSGDPEIVNTGIDLLQVFNPLPAQLGAQYSVAVHTKFGSWIALPLCPLINFELKDNLSSGSNATAYPRNWGGSSYSTDTSTEFEVYDAIGTFTGSIGDNGVAWWAPSSRWEVLQLECT